MFFQNMAPITKVLSIEHAVFCKVFDEFESSLANCRTLKEVNLLASTVEGLLRGHGETETNLAYSALDHGLASKGEVDRLYQDHHEIDDHLKRVHTATDLKEAKRLLKKALGATREHFRREEQVVFPILEETLQPETLAALGQELVAVLSASMHG